MTGMAELREGARVACGVCKSIWVTVLRERNWIVEVR